MARLSRVVVPDAPHRVTQRGKRRQAQFTEPVDHALYQFGNWYHVTVIILPVIGASPRGSALIQ